jgi:cytochrome P450
VTDVTEVSATTGLDEVPFPSAEATSCPFPLYEQLRERDPVHQLPTGEFVVTRHDLIVEAARNPEVFSSRHSVQAPDGMRIATAEDRRDPDRVWPIVGSDGDQHTTKRRLAFEMFKPVRLREQEGMVRGHADDLIDGFIDDGHCEFVHQFADQLPARVILTLFGLPLDGVDRARTWGRYEGMGTRFAAPERRKAANDAISDLGAYLAELVRDRVDSPGDDELSRHVQRHMEHHGKLEFPALVAEASNLFIGGIITTTHLISSLMMLFLRNPEQQQAARSDPGALKSAIEETLRLESPVQWSPRVTVEDTELGGVAIPKDSIVLLAWAAGNRDDCVFADPDRFDAGRENVKEHLGFGNGSHFCLGAPLGRMEARVAFEQIFARMANIRFGPSGDEAHNLESVMFRGPERLEVEFDAVS